MLPTSTPFGSPALSVASMPSTSASAFSQTHAADMAELFASIKAITEKPDGISSKELDFTSLNHDLTVFPFDIVPTSLPLPMTSSSALDFDAQLGSPLGLADESPYSEFLVSPMFDSPPLLPALSPTSSMPSLFPPTATTALRPNPPPPTRRPTLASPPSLSLDEPAPSPVPSTTTSRPTKRLPKPSGFRSSEIPLLPLDAPVQPRTYIVPSATSRKNMTTAVSREQQKRKAIEAAAEKEEREQQSLPDELLAAVEKKRLQNTVAARRSRARKQAKLTELEDDNDRLADENTALKARVALLEGVMKSVGLNVPT
ncbi:transcription factor [Pseudohyphozyma bogoriensis]|nr:transcription factor [Pseudohyphozyma bogoriensis]